jgi:hypothetical protein
MMAAMLLRSERQLILTHRRVLLDQLSKVLDNYGIKYGFRASGKKSNLSAPIQLALTNSEFNRAHKDDRWPLHDCEIVHVDEIHAQTAGMVQTIASAYQNQGAKLLGWTATPREVAHLCEEMVVVATVPELIFQGYLVPPVMFGPDMPDAEALERVTRQSNGEYSVSGLKKIWNCSKIFGRVVEFYNRLNPERRPTILFAPGVPESLWFAERFTERGIRAAHIDGNDVWLDGKFEKSGSGSRQAVFDGVVSGDIKIVCNRFVLREGFDCPSISHAILATPFGSRTSFFQAVGRALRPSPGKTQATIQDHGGAWLNHPAIDSDVEWDMDMSDYVASRLHVELLRGDSENPPRISEPYNCPKCFCVRWHGEACPLCGHKFVTRSRPVIQENGELILVDGPAYRARKIKRAPTDAEDWERIYWGNVSNHPGRTPEQAYSYFAMSNNWRWLPRDLPLMPIRPRHWYVPFGDLTFDDLITKGGIHASR